MELNYDRKTILNIAIPIMLGSVMEHFIGLIDIRFLSELSEAELGGAGLGIHTYFFIFMICYGLTNGSQILMSGAFGRLSYPDIGKIFGNTFLLILSFAILSTLIFVVGVKSLLDPFIQDQEVLIHIADYLQYRSPGVIFTVLNALFFSYFVATSKTKFLTIASFIILVSNGLLDYALIFGNWGFPEMGVKGAALASAIASGFGSITLLICAFIVKSNTKYELFKHFKPSWYWIKAIGKISTPLIGQFLVAFSGWTYFFFVIEKMGPTDLATSMLIRPIHIILLLPFIAFGNTTSTLVSNLTGQKRGNEIYKIILSVIKIAIPLALVVILLCQLFPEQIIRILSNNPVILKPALASFKIVSTSIIIFSVSTVLFNAIVGTGQTKFGLIIEILTMLFYLYPVYLFAIQWEFELKWVWLTEHLYFIVMGVLSWIFLRGKISPK